MPTEVMNTVPPMSTAIVGSRRVFRRTMAITSLDSGQGSSMSELNQLGVHLFWRHGFGLHLANLIVDFPIGLVVRSADNVHHRASFFFRLGLRPSAPR